MSSDNGIYIRPYPNGEYRVAYAMAIENIDWYKKNASVEVQEAFEVDIFHASPVFKSENEAAEFAFEMEKQIGYTEYSVCDICEADFNYPENLTYAEATDILRTFDTKFFVDKVK